MTGDKCQVSVKVRRCDQTECKVYFRDKVNQKTQVDKNRCRFALVGVRKDSGAALRAKERRSNVKLYFLRSFVTTKAHGSLNETNLTTKYPLKFI